MNNEPKANEPFKTTQDKISDFKESLEGFQTLAKGILHRSNMTANRSRILEQDVLALMEKQMDLQERVERIEAQGGIKPRRKYGFGWVKKFILSKRLPQFKKGELE